MSNAIDDKELDEYLSGNTQCSRRYRAIEADAVPENLDRLVISQATATNVVAIGDSGSTTSKRSKSLGFWKRLSVPVALAASLVLVASVVLRSGIRYDTPVIRESEPATPAAMQLSELPMEQAVKDEAKTKKESALATGANKTDNNDAFVAQPSVAQLPLADKPVHAELKRIVAPQVSRTEDAAASDSVAARTAAVSSPPRAVPATPAPAINVAKTIEPPSTRDTATQTSAKSQTADARSLEEVVVTAQLRQSTHTGAGPRGTISPSSFSAREPSDEEIVKQQREATPAAWLIYIRELRASGKSRDANAEWKRFVKAYPNYSVDATDTARLK